MLRGVSVSPAEVSRLESWAVERLREIRRALAGPPIGPAERANLRRERGAIYARRRRWRARGAWPGPDWRRWATEAERHGRGRGLSRRLGLRTAALPATARGCPRPACGGRLVYDVWEEELLCLACARRWEVRREAGA